MRQSGLWLLETHCACRKGGWAHVCLQQACWWSGVPSGATGHASEESDVIIGRAHQSQDLRPGIKFCWERLRASLLVLLVSSHQALGSFPLVFHGEFCNLILLRETHFGMSMVDSLFQRPWCWVTPNLTLLKSTSGAVFISCRGKKELFIRSQLQLSSAAAAGLETEGEAESDFWPQKDFSVKPWYCRRW